MTRYEEVKRQLREQPRRWLVTGVAGFIGSNLLERLLELGQYVVGLDNFSTGHPANLEDVRGNVGEEAWARHAFIEGDIRDPDTCRRAVQKVDLVLHQAALGSIPRSLADPLTTNECNITGFLNVLVAARDAGVKRFIYAASSSTYGGLSDLPKVESRIGRPLSPYAVTKYVNELYASVFQRAYGIETIGLRYFNVFGRRQDPNGAYAAVIPTWVARVLRGDACVINGDGETSRDFCYIENAIQANLLAAATEDASATDQVYNVACGARTTLNELYRLIQAGLAGHERAVGRARPEYGPFREGDVRHSQADISKAERLLGYQPTYDATAGLREALAWYVANLRTRTSAQGLARARDAGGPAIAMRSRAF